MPRRWSCACSSDPGKHEEARIVMPEYTERGVGTAILPEVRPDQLYGYRVYGPYDPRRGKTASMATSC